MDSVERNVDVAEQVLNDDLAIRRHLVRRRSRVLSKVDVWLAVGFLMVLFPVDARATCIAWTTTGQIALLGVDSLVVNAFEQPMGNVCKLHVRHNLAWAAWGIYEHPDTGFSLDAVMREVEKHPPDEVPGVAERVLKAALEPVLASWLSDRNGPGWKHLLMTNFSIMGVDFAFPSGNGVLVARLTFAFDPVSGRIAVSSAISDHPMGGCDGTGKKACFPTLGRFGHYPDTGRFDPIDITADNIESAIMAEAKVSPSVGGNIDVVAVTAAGVEWVKQGEECKHEERVSPQPAPPKPEPRRRQKK